MQFSGLLWWWWFRFWFLVLLFCRGSMLLRLYSLCGYCKMCLCFVFTIIFSLLVLHDVSVFTIIFSRQVLRDVSVFCVHHLFSLPVLRDVFVFTFIFSLQVLREISVFVSLPLSSLCSCLTSLTGSWVFPLWCPDRTCQRPIPPTSLQWLRIYLSSTKSSRCRICLKVREYIQDLSIINVVAVQSVFQESEQGKIFTVYTYTIFWKNKWIIYSIFQ